MFRKTVCLVVVAVLVFGIVGVTNEGETTLEEARRTGIIRVGFNNVAPWAYVEPKGALAGASVDIAMTIFERIGIDNAIAVIVPWSALIPSLKAKRFDAITAGMYIKPERCAEVIFSEPTLSTGWGLIVSYGNPLEIHSVDDLINNSNIRVASPPGGYEWQDLVRLGFPESRMVFVDGPPEGIAAIEAGRADAYLANDLTCADQASKHPGVELATPWTDPVLDGKSVRGYAGTAFHKDDGDLRDAYNEELSRLKETGELLEIIAVYGLTELNLPGDKTTAELCGGESE